jgi:hypothetical protein
MKYPNTLRHKRSEAGVALLIALFALLLISVVGIALVAASSSETSLAGNYRNSSSSFYAAAAGVEEGRGRLLASNPNYFGALVAPFGGAPLLLGQARYILNPAPGENAATLLVTYPDANYTAEFNGTPYAIPVVVSMNSMYTGAANPGPLYKWVRINAITEASLNVNVGNHALPLDSTKALYFDGAHLNTTSTGNQALEITALAVLPNGSQKILQYVVAPTTYNLNFPGALTLAGQVGAFSGANSNQYYVNGTDGSGSPPAVPGCTIPNPPTVKPAIAVTDTAGTTTNKTLVTAALPRPDHYIGSPASVSDVVPTGSLATPASLDQIIQTIKLNADAVIPNPPLAPNVNNSGTTYTFGGPGWPASVTATNPGVVYVDGSFDLGPNTGSGLLVVTGNFSYHGNSGWNGIILVVGDGTTTFLGNGGGSGSFNGAIFTATTRDASGTQLANFGTSNFDISGGGGNGVYYNSCWVNSVQKPPSYQVLSFRER